MYFFFIWCMENELPERHGEKLWKILSLKTPLTTLFSQRISFNRDAMIIILFVFI